MRPHRVEMIVRRCAGLAFLLASQCAAAGALYVALNGDNSTGDGSISKPYRTLYKAGIMAQPGTVIYVRGGTYLTYNEFIHITAGTSDAPVLIQPYPGEQAIFDASGTSTASGSILTLNQSSHVILDGLELRNSPWGGLTVTDSTDVVVRNMRVHDLQNYGITMSGQQLTADGNHVWNAVLRNSGNSTGACGCWGSALNSLPWSSGAPSQNVVFRNNLVHDAWGEGIGVYITDTAQVVGNTVHDSYSVNIYLTQARNVVVDRNYLYALDGSHNRSGYPATGISLATEPNYVNLQQPTITPQNITLSNNVIVGAGIGLNYFYSTLNPVPENTYQDLRIVYNVIRAPLNTSIRFLPVQNNSLAPSGVLVSDNIIEQGANGQALYVGNPAGWSYANNLWPGGVPAAAQEPGSLAGNPAFASPVLGGPAGGFRLSRNSPALGKGKPTAYSGHDFDNAARGATASSIGAFEQPAPAAKAALAPLLLLLD